MTSYLRTEDMLALTADLNVGPVRDLGLLESATHRPRTVLWGAEAYPSLETKAASLLESVVRNHPLVDGNKRLGWLSVVVFYELNGVFLEAPDDEAYDLVISVASGELGVDEVAHSLRRWRDQS
ncbi:type II toxin-antitoxin system death-on-curing family toxin [Brevibacterium oceani]|uniref:type II toxin-antitoxin system death-on-curing family toxin n=1 Tax=Brevibacterium oceani TaxID=358099 RepID=UPI001B32FF6F|nr:type II toxin-antitoxin system death-on-curing family toxin [Brevibacterium oceani]